MVSKTQTCLKQFIHIVYKFSQICIHATRKSVPDPLQRHGLGTQGRPTSPYHYLVVRLIKLARQRFFMKNRTFLLINRVRGKEVFGHYGFRIKFDLLKRTYVNQLEKMTLIVIFYYSERIPSKVKPLWTLTSILLLSSLFLSQSLHLQIQSVQKGRVLYYHRSLTPLSAPLFCLLIIFSRRASEGGHLRRQIKLSFLHPLVRFADQHSRKWILIPLERNPEPRLLDNTCHILQLRPELWDDLRE